MCLYVYVLVSFEAQQICPVWKKTKKDVNEIIRWPI